MTTAESLEKQNGRSPAELLARVSASRLQTFHQCRLKFYFRYVLRLEKPKSPALHVGSAVHFVLQTWNRARWKGEVIDLAMLFFSRSRCACLAWEQTGDVGVATEQEAA
jgi:putative RecB family exonuclease